MINRLTESSYRNTLKLGIDTLRAPAGEKAEYGSTKKISENREAFIKDYHAGLKGLHSMAVNEIRQLDRLISRGRKDKVPSALLELLELWRSFWRKINDGIAWIIVQHQRHIIKRLCLYHERGKLDEHNPESVLRELEKINQDPYSIAIWNDATSCLDVGDITHWNMKTDELSFIEMKAGKVNHKISSMKFEDVKEMEELYLEYGKKGIKQLDRYMKQLKTRHDVMKLINEERGIDPITGQEMTIAESSLPEETYDKELRLMVAKAKESGQAIMLIDDLLWLYVTQRNGRRNEEITKTFSDEVSRLDAGCAVKWVRENLGKGQLWPTVSLQNNLSYQISNPLMFRYLDSNDIVDIVHGKLLVLSFLDWLRFPKVVESCGAKFRWSSKKQGRAEKNKPKSHRIFVLGDRFPIISLEGNSEFHLGTPQILRIHYDAIKPKNMLLSNIQGYGEHLKKSRDEKNER